MWNQASPDRDLTGNSEADEDGSEGVEQFRGREAVGRGQWDVPSFHDDLVDNMNVTVGAFKIRPDHSSLEIFPLDNRIVIS